MENITGILQALLSFIGVILTAILGYVFSVKLLRRQKQQNKALEDAEIEKKKNEIREIVTRQFEALTNELQEERGDLRKQIQEQKKIIKELQAKIREMEKSHADDLAAFDKERMQLVETFLRKERGYENAINGLTNRIVELEGRLEGVKKDTDQLKSKENENSDAKR